MTKNREFHELMGLCWHEPSFKNIDGRRIHNITTELSGGGASDQEKHRTIKRPLE